MLMAFIYLGLIFAGATYIYQRIQRFEGILIVSHGKAESIVIRPSEDGFSFTPMQRKLPPDVIPFDQPQTARRLDAREHFDIAKLPFRIRLDDVETLDNPPPKNILEVTEAGTKHTHELTPGITLELAGQSVALHEISPWAGLIRNPSGRPMAAISMRRAETPWTEAIFLESGAWRHIEPNIALRLRWFRNEKDARQALSETPPGIGEAQWGISGDGRMHWFRSFAPGTGLTLDDGTEFTLIAYDETHPGVDGPHPAIYVERRKHDEGDRRWIQANDSEVSSVVKFDFPGIRQTILLLDTWRDGAALVSAFENGERSGPQFLEESDLWQPEDFPYELRLDQIIATALPVTGEEAPVLAARFETHEGPLILREGEVQTWQNLRLRFRRPPSPPLVNYRLAAFFGQHKPPREGILTPDGAWRAGDWRFRQTRDNPDAAQTAVLTATRTLGDFPKLIGAAMFIAGCFGMVWLRFHRKTTAAGIFQQESN